MTVIRDVVKAHLAERDWTYDEHDTFLAVPVSAGTADWLMLFYLPDDIDHLIVHSLVPVEVLDHEYLNVALYLTLANFDLTVGNFEMDLRDGPNWGEIRYKTSLDLRDVELTVPMVRNLVEANVQTVDVYLAGLRQAAGGRPAGECIAEAES